MFLEVERARCLELRIDGKKLLHMLLLRLVRHIYLKFPKFLTESMKLNSAVTTVIRGFRMMILYIRLLQQMRRRQTGMDYLDMLDYV